MNLNDEALKLLRMHAEMLDDDRQNQSPELSLVEYFHEFVSDFEPSLGDERERNAFSFGFLQALAAVHGTSACRVLEFGQGLDPGPPGPPPAGPTTTTTD